jgi:hypothetical protein
VTASVGVSGAWKGIASVAVGVSGAWKTVAQGWVGVGGAWKQFYTAITIALPGAISGTDVQSPGPANATITFASNGTYSATGGASGNWGSPTTGGLGSGYDIRWTVVSGTLTTGTTGTWQSLSAGITYGRNRVAVGIATASGTVEIRDASTLAVLATSTVTLEAEVS